MQVQFSSFHNYFCMQVQVGVLPELIFELVVMQVPFPFPSIPGFWGTLLGLRHCREDSVGIFALENRSHWVGVVCVVSLEVLRTEIISLQCWLTSIEMLASKSNDAYQGRAPRETIEKCLKIGLGFRFFGWCWFGVCFLDREGRAPSFRKIRTRICAAKSKVDWEWVPTLVPSVLAHSGIVFWTLGLKTPGKCP